MTTHTLTSTIALATLLSSITAPLIAQVHYDAGSPWNQRAESGPEAEVPGWFYNLGITGKDVPPAK